MIELLVLNSNIFSDFFYSKWNQSERIQKFIQYGQSNDYQGLQAYFTGGMKKTGK